MLGVPKHPPLRDDAFRVLRVTGWRPARLNELISVHWTQKYKRKNADRQKLLVECQNQNIPRAVGKRRLSLVWILGKGDRTPDQDGLHKSLLDGLVLAGRLRDDSPKWLELGPTTFRREAVSGVEVTLEDIE